MAHHARLLADLDDGAARDARLPQAHVVVLHGYPVGGETRRRFANVSTLAELEDLIAPARPGDRARRGRRADPPRAHERPDPVVLPYGYRDHLDDRVVPDDGHVMALSGG
jgi:hypothetical protein